MLNEKKTQEILKKAVSLWGLEERIGMLEEECCEVIHAVCKYRRVTVPSIENLTKVFDKICEEAADVKIMIAQIETERDFKQMIDKWVAFKLGRLITTMYDYEREENAKKTIEGS